MTDNLEQIFQCFRCIRNEKNNLQVRKDFYLALTLMLIPNLEKFLKTIVDNDKKKLSLEILNATLNNAKDIHLNLFLNRLCSILIEGDLTTKEKITLLNNLRKNKVFLANIHKIDSWFYNNPKKNESSFLGMIIKDLSFFDAKLFQNFLKKKILKKHILTWLYGVLEQNKDRIKLGIEEDDNSCSDKFILKIMSELVSLYYDGKSIDRTAQLNLKVIYNKDYKLDFGQTRNEEEINTNYYNEYFLMAIKSIQLGFISLMNKTDIYNNEIEYLEESIEYLTKMRQHLLNSQNTSQVVGSIIYLERIEEFKQTLNTKRTQLQNIEDLLSNKSLYYLVVETISDLLYVNNDTIEYLTDNLLDTLLCIFTKAIENDVYVHENLMYILIKVIDNKKFNYHTKIKIIDFMVKYNKITHNRIKFIDINCINSFHSFYNELGEKQIEDYYRLQVRYNMLFLINNYINDTKDSSNIGIYLSNFTYLDDEHSDTPFKSDFIKFIHITISDLETIISNILSYVESIIKIDEQLLTGRTLENNILKNEDIIRLKKTRKNYSFLVNSSSLIIISYLRYIKLISYNDLRIFKQYLIANLFTTTIKYLFDKLVTNKMEFSGNENNIKLKMLTYVGNIVDNVCQDEELMVYFIKDDQSCIISMCKSLISLYMNTKTYNIMNVAVLIDNIDYDISVLTKIKSRVEAEEDDDISEEIPEDFMDPIMMTLMEDPVELPSSNIILDKNTILQQLLHCEQDPYSRVPLTKELLEEHNMKEDVKSKIDELKLKINKWVKKC